jgi:hypothetical protein
VEDSFNVSLAVGVAIAAGAKKAECSRAAGLTPLRSCARSKRSSPVDLLSTMRSSYAGVTPGEGSVELPPLDPAALFGSSAMGNWGGQSIRFKVKAAKPLTFRPPLKQFCRVTARDSGQSKKWH